MPSILPVRRCDATIKQLGLLLGLFFGAAEATAAELVVQSASARPGETVDIAIVLNPQESGVAAVVFEVDYDVSKLVFDPDSPGSASVGTADASDFAVETFDDRASAGRVGVAIYDPVAPVLPLPAGLVATLRFQVRPDASGYASVTIGGSPPDAADSDGKKVPVSVSQAPSGVAISGGRARAVRSR